MQQIKDYITKLETRLTKLNEGFETEQDFRTRLRSIGEIASIELVIKELKEIVYV